MAKPGVEHLTFRAKETFSFLTHLTPVNPVKFAKDYKFVSKEDAAKEHEKVFGENFMEFLGANPLNNSYDIHLKADYVTNPGFGKAEAQIRANPMVADVVYDKQLITLVNDNIKYRFVW